MMGQMTPDEINASLFDELKKERARLRATAQRLIEATGADGPMDAEEAAARAIGQLESARAELDAVALAVRQPAGGNPPGDYTGLGALARESVEQLKQLSDDGGASVAIILALTQERDTALAKLASAEARALATGVDALPKDATVIKTAKLDALRAALASAARVSGCAWREEVVSHACRWAQNMLVDVQGNHAGYMTEAARQCMHTAIAALAEVPHAMAKREKEDT